jgi:hypothetical protein
MDPKDELVCVANFTTAEQAAIAQINLEAQGIRCALNNQTTAGLFWYMSDAIGGVGILVAKTDQAKALELLDELAANKTDLIGDAWKINPDDESQNVATQEVATDPDLPMSAREENANRALRGAVLGVLFAPLQLYVFYLLLFKVFASDEPIRPVYTRRAWQAAAINIPYIAVILIVIRWTIYGL